MLIILGADTFGQQDSFDVFTYSTPEFFTKSQSPAEMRLNLTNEDGSFCTITLYKCRPAASNIKQDISHQWKVVKQLPKSDKKPSKILTGELLDGWAFTLAIGNFYHNKKKAVVMLYSFRINNTTAFAIVAFTDKIFKGPVESFSNNLHLTMSQKK